MGTILRIIWPFIIIGLGAGAAYMVVANHKPPSAAVNSFIPPQAKASPATPPSTTLTAAEFDKVKKDWTDRSVAFQPGTKDYKDATIVSNDVKLMAEFAKKNPGIQLQLFGWTDGSVKSEKLVAERVTKLTTDLKDAGAKNVESIGNADYKSKKAANAAEQKKRIDTVDVTIAPKKP